jgi:hypothetical protein
MALSEMGRMGREIAAPGHKMSLDPIEVTVDEP